MNEMLRTMPFMSIRGLVVFPGSEVILIVGRAVSVRAIDAALAMPGRQIVLIAQRESEKNDDVGLADLHDVGTIAVLEKVVRLDDAMKLFVVAKERLTVQSMALETPARAQFVTGVVLAPPAGRLASLVAERERLVAQVRDWCAIYSPSAPPSAWEALTGARDMRRFLDLFQRTVATFHIGEPMTAATHAAMAREGLSKQVQKDFDDHAGRINRMVAARQRLLEAEDVSSRWMLARVLIEEELRAALT